MAQNPTLPWERAEILPVLRQHCLVLALPGEWGAALSPPLLGRQMDGQGLKHNALCVQHPHPGESL